MAHDQDRDEPHAVHPGTEGGMGGSGPERPVDPEAHRAFIERSRETGVHLDDAGTTVHEAEAGLDLGADDEASGPGQA